jgi:hypothetical protein
MGSTALLLGLWLAAVGLAIIAGHPRMRRRVAWRLPLARRSILRRCREELERLQTESEILAAKLREREREMMARYVGGFAETMSNDPESLPQYLDHPDPRFRCVALHLLQKTRPRPEWLAKLSQQLADGDPDPQVRGVAVHCLGTCYAGTNDARIGKVVAAKVRSTSEDDRVRAAAFFVLHEIRGVCSLEWPLATWRFPEDVDWSFVDTFFREN